MRLSALFQRILIRVQHELLRGYQVSTSLLLRVACRLALPARPQMVEGDFSVTLRPPNRIESIVRWLQGGLPLIDVPRRGLLNAPGSDFQVWFPVGQRSTLAVGGSLITQTTATDAATIRKILLARLSDGAMSSDVTDIYNMLARGQSRDNVAAVTPRLLYYVSFGVGVTRWPASHGLHLTVLSAAPKFTSSRFALDDEVWKMDT